MTANRRLVTVIIAVFASLFILGQLRFFGLSAGPEALVGIAALVPVFLVAGLVWFGHEVITTLRRIEAATVGESDGSPEFIHGS